MSNNPKDSVSPPVPRWVKKGVLTSYYNADTKYCSYILGDDIQKIKKAAAKRGLNEKIESRITDVEMLPDYSQLSDTHFLNQLPEIIHSACFLSFVALKAGTVTINEILSDNGVIHELSHLLASGESCDTDMKRIKGLIKNLQQNAIGFYKPCEISDEPQAQAETKEEQKQAILQILHEEAEPYKEMIGPIISTGILNESFEKVADRIISLKK